MYPLTESNTYTQTHTHTYMHAHTHTHRDTQTHTHAHTDRHSSVIELEGAEKTSAQQDETQLTYQTPTYACLSVCVCACLNI